MNPIDGTVYGPGDTGLPNNTVIADGICTTHGRFFGFRCPSCTIDSFPPLGGEAAYDPLKDQVGGDHYKKMKIQPAEYCHKNRIGKLEGDVIAYVSRWRDKNGIEDLRKARHTLDMIIKLEEANTE